MEVSHKTKDTLLKAGWYPNRKVDITEAEKLIVSRGFVVYEPVKKFLEEFMDLNIEAKSDKMKGRIEIHNTIIKDLYYPGFRRSGESEDERNARQCLYLLEKSAMEIFFCIYLRPGKCIVEWVN